MKEDLQSENGIVWLKLQVRSAASDVFKIRIGKQKFSARISGSYIVFQRDRLLLDNYGSRPPSSLRAGPGATGSVASFFHFKWEQTPVGVHRFYQTWATDQISNVVFDLAIFFFRCILIWIDSLKKFFIWIELWNFRSLFFVLHKLLVLSQLGKLIPLN